jgi:hypothetical protein
MLVTFLTCLVVDVGEGIEFVDYDVDVVTADAVTLAGDTLAFVHAGDGVELTAADLAFFRIEVGSDGIYTSRVAHENHTVSQLFGLQMEVETRAVVVDDQL